MAGELVVDRTLVGLVVLLVLMLLPLSVALAAWIGDRGRQGRREWP